jgi:hypothetical protein
MIRFIIVCLINGLLFGVMDGIMNANPLAQKLFKVYKPLAKTSVNIPLGITIDILYGFAIGFIFLLLYRSLPGDSGIIKGVVFGIIIWFFRVLMQVVSSGMTMQIPAATMIYSLSAGLVEMLVLGLIYGLFLKPLNL